MFVHTYTLAKEYTVHTYMLAKEYIVVGDRKYVRVMFSALQMF